MDDSSFFSMNRLVEFGMGMAVAQQMVKTMNESMTSMHVPGTMNQMEQTQQKFFYAVTEGNQIGPLSEQEVIQLIQKKRIVNETYMWKPGMLKWELAERIPEVVQLVALTPPPLPENLNQ